MLRIKKLRKKMLFADMKKEHNLRIKELFEVRLKPKIKMK